MIKLPYNIYIIYLKAKRISAMINSPISVKFKCYSMNACV